MVLITIPSPSTRMIVASLYSLPLVVLKSSASAIDTDSAAKIGSVVLKYVTLRILLLCSLHGNDKMKRINDAQDVIGLTTTWSISKIEETRNPSGENVLRLIQIRLAPSLKKISFFLCQVKSVSDYSKPFAVRRCSIQSARSLSVGLQ